MNLRIKGSIPVRKRHQNLNPPFKIFSFLGVCFNFVNFCPFFLGEFFFPFPFSLCLLALKGPLRFGVFIFKFFCFWRCMDSLPGVQTLVFFQKKPVFGFFPQSFPRRFSFLKFPPFSFVKGKIIFFFFFGF